MRTQLRVGVAVLGLTLLSSGAYATDLLHIKEQYERDRHRITDALSKGTLVKGPERVRDSILISEDEWYKLNYPEQIALMQAYECFMGRGKQFLYLDVRSLSTGKLLAPGNLAHWNPPMEAASKKFWSKPRRQRHWRYRANACGLHQVGH